MRLRKAYVEFDHWQIGQGWASFGDEALWPNIMEWEGPPSGVWLRSPHIKYFNSFGNPNWRYIIALDAPLTDYNKYGEMVSSWKRTSMQLDGFSGCCNPSHIAMLSNGSFVTSEKGIERVKIHLPSGEFSCVVASPDQFEPETRGLDLAVDSEDRIFVLDPKKKLVRIYDESGNETELK